MAAPTLTLRQLNRATLARQLLLAREKLPLLRALERIGGLQAQLARPPFVALWSRLTSFRRADLARLLESHEVVRATLMRGTLHLMTTKDFLALRASLQPGLDKGMRSILRDRLKDIDLDATLATARAFFEDPHPFDDLRDRFKKGDARAMAYAVRCLLPLVQVPTSDPWSFPSAASFTLAESWLGRPIPLDSPDPRPLVQRYLGAFGPATVADMQCWSGLPALRDTFEALRPTLATFRDPRGRELFDLKKAPRPDEKTPAPARLLPEFDSLLLAHDDRTRLIDDAHRPIVVTKNLQVRATLLVDGRIAGTWSVARAKRSATLELAPFAPLPKKALDELSAEATALLRFTEPDAETHEIAVAKPAR